MVQHMYPTCTFGMLIVNKFDGMSRVILFSSLLTTQLGERVTLVFRETLINLVWPYYQYISPMPNVLGGGDLGFPSPWTIWGRKIGPLDHLWLLHLVTPCHTHSLFCTSNAAQHKDPVTNYTSPWASLLPTVHVLCSRLPQLMEWTRLLVQAATQAHVMYFMVCIRCLSQNLKY